MNQIALDRKSLIKDNCMSEETFDRILVVWPSFLWFFFFLDHAHHIIPRHLQPAIRNDEKLNKLLDSVTIAQGGVPLLGN